jgi:arabinofuranosyltransferase
MEITSQKEQSDGVVYLIIVLFIIFGVVLVRSAWVSDDAYITLRMVDNLYHGFGLTWNSGERVMASTHPLWMLVIASTYFAVENPYYLLIILSLAISLFAVYLMIAKLSVTSLNSILGLLLLISSKAVIDYSTSGLENPLTNLIFIIFIIILLNNRKGVNQFLLLSLVASLGVLNRYDTILLFLPALIYLLITQRSLKQDLLYMTLGFSPLIIWGLFSLFYYGFIFPNTAYAKLNTGINSFLLIKQGILYVLNTLSRDPASIIIIIFSIVVSFISRDRRKIAISLGMILYILYVIRVGGDFMSGRFFSAVVFGGIALIVNTKLPKSLQNFTFVMLVTALIFAATPNPPILYNAGDTQQPAGVMGIYNGIEDERLWYYQLTGLLTMTRDQIMPRMAWADLGTEAKERNYGVVIKDSVGVFGYYAGPTVYVIDRYALGDPLLSRLKIPDQNNWRIGHFSRDLPEGYLETLETHENHIQDANLSAYYDKLSIITRGELFDYNRIVEILKMNLGVYDPLLEAYIKTQQ